MLMRVILGIVALFGILWTASRFRRRDASRVMFLAWAFLWFAVGVVAFIPELTSRLADLLGIGRGADVVVYTAIVVIVAILFRMSIRLEQLDRAITKVTREVALRHNTPHDGDA